MNRFFYNTEKEYIHPSEYHASSRHTTPINIITEFDDLHLLDHIPAIDSLILEGGDAEHASFDSLYRHTEIRSLMLDYYEADDIDLWTIDVSRFPDLKILVSRSSYDFVNVSLSKSLKALLVGEWHHHDLGILAESEIESLVIANGKKLHSLSGFRGGHLKELSISYSPIKQISSLSSFNRLELFEADNCKHIADWCAFAPPSLKVLTIIGNSVLPSISFVNCLPLLQSFVFEGCIEDGDLFPLKRLERCFVAPHKRHYNIPHKELNEDYSHKTALSIDPEYDYYRHRII